MRWTLVLAMALAVGCKGRQPRSAGDVQEEPAPTPGPTVSSEPTTGAEGTGDVALEEGKPRARTRARRIESDGRLHAYRRSRIGSVAMRRHVIPSSVEYSRSIVPPVGAGPAKSSEIRCRVSAA